MLLPAESERSIQASGSPPVLSQTAINGDGLEIGLSEFFGSTRFNREHCATWSQWHMMTIPLEHSGERANECSIPTRADAPPLDWPERVFLILAIEPVRMG